MESSLIPIEIRFPVRAVTYPAPDLSGVWLAHSLDLDMMAQGNSPQHAASSLVAALAETVTFRISQGLPPVIWSSAPEEIWAGAETAAGQKLDRHPPEIDVQLRAENDNNFGSPLPTQVFQMDHAPVAHAG